MSDLTRAESARRRFVVEALSSGLLGGVIVIPLSTRAQGIVGNVPRQMPSDRSVYRSGPSVTVDDVPLTPSTIIRPGSTVHTAADSEAIFVVGTSALLLRPESRISLTTIAAASAGPREVGGFRLWYGRVLAVFGGGYRRIETVTASVSIQGTGVYLEARPDETYFCTCYGRASVSAKADPQQVEEVVSRQHDRPLTIRGASSGGAPGLIRAAPFVNHTDQELALIEALVGRVPPFIHPKQQYERPRDPGYRR